MSPETGHIMCGANDYRAADRLDGVLGDAWMGVLMSRDGLTWISRLAPGFRGDAGASLNFGFGADPIVLAFPGGMVYVFIAGDRGDNAPGGVFAQQWVEVNKEDGYPFVPASGRPKTIATGTAGRFLDKPAAMLNMLGSGTCTIPYTTSDGAAATRTVPAFEVSVAYATFLGSDTSDGTAVWVVRSSDCGATWDTPGKKVTQTLSINQGVSLAAIGSRYLAVWRTFTDPNQPQAQVQYSVSTTRGQTWSKPGTIAAILPFDQGTSAVTFRTNALPWSISDGTAFHVFWAERRSASDPLARIKVSSSTTGTGWSAPEYVDDAPVGHEFMPSAASANGITQVAWYDTRDDRTQTFTPFINDYKDANGVIHRHTADIRAAQGTWNGSRLVFSPSVKVSSYRIGRAPAGFVSPGSPSQVIKLEDNFVNSRIFKQGTVPFLGDYLAVATKTLVRSGSSWVPNTAPTGQIPSFFVAWTDNRRLRGNTVADLVEPTGYTPLTFAPFQGESDPAQPPAPCTATDDLSNTRNQEVFGAMIRPGLVVRVPSAAKPTSTVQRAFVVHVANTTSQPRTYKLQITNQPPDAPPSGTGRASFVQHPVSALVTTADTEKCLALPRRSGAAVTVFVTSTSVSPAVHVQVNEADASSCAIVPGASASVTLNGNPLAPDIENPDFENPDFENFDIQSFEIHNPDIENKTYSFISITNPDIENPDFENYTLAFPDIENPDFENPDFENATIAYPDIENPDMENPDFENAVISAGGVTEVTWSVTMKGNTTSGLDARGLFSKLPTTMTQLVVRIVYRNAAGRNCALVQTATNQVVVNTVAQPGQRPDGSFYLSPGQVALITVRIPGSVLPETVGLNVTAQADNTGANKPADEDLPAGDVAPPVLTVPDPITVEAAGASGATVTYAASAIDEGAGQVPALCSPASGSVFPIGSTTVTCSADDGLGNTSTASFTVTVVDSTAPVVGPHADITAEATSASGATVAYTSPTASDAVGVVSYVCAPASGTTFPLGQTSVTCTALDAAGNAGAGTFTVTVRDTTPPALTGVPDNFAVVASGATGAIATYVMPTAVDLVDGTVSVACAPASGSLFPFGTTTVACSAQDSRENAVSASFTVTVGLAFVGLKSPWKPPSPIYTVNLGSSVPVNWDYRNAAGGFIDTSTAMPTVTFTLLQSCSSSAETSVVYVNQASPGNSYFKYDGDGWHFNWQTAAPVTAGCYNIRVILNTSGQVDGPFLIRLR